MSDWTLARAGYSGAAPRSGAHNGTRTHDLFLTKEVLCQLSYVGPLELFVWMVGREGIEPPQSKDG